MKSDKRFRRGAVVVSLICFAIALGLNLFYNDAHAARGLDRALFQVLVAGLLAVAVLAAFAYAWFAATAQDEVVRAAARASTYWGFALGTFIWLLTPWTSLPQMLVAPMSNPNGDTLFTLSEAAGTYTGGGLVLLLLVSSCSTIIRVGWWATKR